MNKKLLSGILASTFALTSTLSLATPVYALENTTALVAQSTQTLSTSPEEDFTIGTGGVITAYKGEGGNVVIPSTIDGKTVYEIGEEVFYKNKTIESITLPSTVETVGDYAMAECEHLRSVTLNEGLQKLGGNVFRNCEKLTSVWIPSTVVEMGKSVFLGSGITSGYIPSTVKIIGPYTFYQCSRLTDVIFMADVDELPQETFRDCIMLNNVYLHEGIVTIGVSAFQGCTALKEITLPSTTTTINNNAFTGCTKLEKMDMTNTVLKEICYRAFNDCDSLKEVILPYGFLLFSEQSSARGPYVFVNCPSLEKLVAPSSLTKYYTATSNYSYTTTTFEKVSTDFTIYSYSGTTSEKYAESKDLKFSSLGSVSSEPQPTIVPTTPPTLPTAPNATTPEVTTPTVTPEVSASKIATPSTAKVMVNGAEVPFGAYNIDGYNYFKLTDIAYSIHGTAKQFNVGWDSSANAIGISLNQVHTLLGTELEANSGKNETADLFQSPIFCDGTQVYPIAYIINGSSYFQLNALIDIVGITVGWDGETSTITITT